MSEIKYVPHPGEYLKDAIEELGMSQNEFAIRIGTTGKTISKISEFLGTSVNLWLNLQTSYNEYLRKLELKKQEEEELKILSYFDKNYLNSILDIEVTKNNKNDVIKELKQLFMVNSLSCLK